MTLIRLARNTWFGIAIVVCCMLSAERELHPQENGSNPEQKQEPVWRQHILLAKGMALPGVTNDQLVKLYGPPSFTDDKARLWYRLTPHELDQIDGDRADSTEGYVVFEIKMGKLTKVDTVLVVVPKDRGKNRKTAKKDEVPKG